MFFNSPSQEVLPIPLTEVLRKGARALLAQAVEAEVATLHSRYAGETTVVRRWVEGS
jgi:hypothetical protein